ncbi:MAG: hypothetical protein ABIW38_01815 [Ferruginibacter sp.]
MKKLTGFFALVVIILLSACNDKEAEVKKEVIVVPAPSKPVIVVNPGPAKSTNVVLDKNGVSVETKKVGVVIKH